jgi:[acyl-carrier-protein] S-malonyltransferase
VLAILCPGQGAQRAGMSAAWLDLPGVRDAVATHSDAAGVDLAVAGTEYDAEQVTDTAVAQPLLVSTALVSAGLLGPLPGDTVYAGHSVGELAAVALAGALTSDDAVRLVAARGAAMAAASAERRGGMVAVIGGDADEVESAITAAGCVAANRNGAGQVVAAGSADDVERLLAAPPAGARLRRLAVAGAFHSPLMAAAVPTVREAAAGIVTRPMHSGWLSDLDGTLVTDHTQVLGRLVRQVTASVRWDAVVETLPTLGVTAVVELAPGGTLTGLVRRELPDVATVAVKSPDDLPAARELVAEHAHDLAEEHPPWRVVVSPTRGTVHLAADHDEAAPGSRPELTADALLARVATRTESLDVPAGGGRLIEWLVSDGDPVAAGQPLARLTTRSP